jgi:hypothetical protein
VQIHVSGPEGFPWKCEAVVRMVAGHEWTTLRYLMFEQPGRFLSLIGR